MAGLFGTLFLNAYVVITRSLEFVVDILEKSGYGIYKFGKSDIQVNGEEVRDHGIVWLKMGTECTIRFDSSPNKTLHPLMDKPLTKERGVFLIHKVTTFLKGAIPDRSVMFESVNVYVQEDPLFNKKNSDRVYGYATVKDRNHMTIHISTYEVSELSFASTYIHELVHCLAPDYHHGTPWLETCGLVMGLVWDHIDTYKDLEDFSFIACPMGLNIEKVDAKDSSD